jgi:single stranded DNA-binding protein (ssb)
MNNVVLIGRLTRNPEIRYAQGNTMMIAKFSLAVNRQKKGDADFINITVFGKTAEMCEKYLEKGKQIGIQGRIQTGNYEKDGKRVYTFGVIADRIEFIGSAKTNNEDNEAIPQGFIAITEDIEDDCLPF